MLCKGLSIVLEFSKSKYLIGSPVGVTTSTTSQSIFKNEPSYLESGKPEKLF